MVSKPSKCSEERGHPTMAPCTGGDWLQLARMCNSRPWARPFATWRPEGATPTTSPQGAATSMGSGAGRRGGCRRTKVATACVGMVEAA
ncbi:hypothetical protein GW17_00045272 [Ensete ventricosum]|nr:hypothetical protein GW17_00045272 [Ensete ventricosum]